MEETIYDDSSNKPRLQPIFYPPGIVWPWANYKMYMYKIMNSFKFYEGGYPVHILNIFSSIKRLNLCMEKKRKKKLPKMLLQCLH